LNTLKWFGRLILGVAAVGACWVAWYIVYQDSQARMQAAPEERRHETPTVEVMPAQQGRIEEHITLVGSLFPDTQTEIRSRVDGYVKAIPVYVGDRVEAGDVVCLLDDTDAREEVSRSQAVLNVAQAQFRAQQTERDLAENTVERMRNLFGSGSSTTQQLETAEANLRIAIARVELEQSRIEEAQVNLQRAKLALENLKLRSSVSGFVAERLISVGDLAKPDTPILRIVDLDVVQTTVHVVEKDYRKVSVGQSAEVTVDAFPEEVFHGKVKRIAPVLDPETRTGAVHLDVENSDRLLKPGMYARVALRSHESREGVLIPQAALLSERDRPSVLVVDLETSQIESRRVTVGTTRGGLVEVRQGLTAEDQVVTLGGQMVRPGQTVNALRVAWPDELLATAGITHEVQPDSAD
jgi:membrane fusion protein, multidrug efflux system